MEFYKQRWERKTPPALPSETLISEMLNPIFPNKKIETFTLVSTGLLNTNICLKFKGQNELFLLRIYAGNHGAIHQEAALAKRYGKNIPMPEFLHIEAIKEGPTYAIQRWIEGKPLYEFFSESTNKDLPKIAENIGILLGNIGKIAFSTGGFFKEDLQIQPFESEAGLHPFSAYIKACLEKEHAGKWLGTPLKEKLWDFVLETQGYLPPLEPACLVHGDFNPDNIVIDPNTLKVAALLDWEFAFSGSYLFDIGNLLRFQVPTAFEQCFITAYQTEKNMILPSNWKKIIKIQDLSNLVGLINTPKECPNRLQDVKNLIENTLIDIKFDN